MGPRTGLDVFGEQKNPLLLAGFEPRTVQHLSCSLYRLRYSGSIFVFFGGNKRVKIKLSLCLDKHHTLKAHKKWRHSFTIFFISSECGDG